MQIVSLNVENIMRIAAAYVTAEGEPVMTIGGMNGQGKSSLLDAIAMAIGGKRLHPPEPLRRGQLSGQVTVDLGRYVVTRKFWRETADSPIASSLVVSSPEGAEYRSPQALLDKLVTDLTFDPLAFLDLQPAAQREYVRGFVGLDFRKLDADRAAALEAARECDTVLKVAEHDVKAGEYYPDAPADLVDVQALVRALEDAEHLARAAAEVDRAVDAKRRNYQATLEAIVRTDAAILALEQELQTLRVSATQLAEQKVREEAEGQALRATAQQARSVVPDTSLIRDQFAQASTVNARVQANKRHAALLVARDEAQAEVTQVRARIAGIDAEKRRQLEAATFPVPGLSFSDTGLMFDGLPFEQASYAQQLRVAVAMGLASNPALKVLLIKHGNALDSKSLALLTSLAQEQSAQVWIERVAESAAGVSVLIEDGRVVAVHGEVPGPERQVCTECGTEWAGFVRGCTCQAPAVPV